MEREREIKRNAISKGRKDHSKRQNGQAKILHKKDTHTLTIIASLREQLNIHLSTGELQMETKTYKGDNENKMRSIVPFRSIVIAMKNSISL